MNQKRVIDADELLKLAKATQKKLYAEDFDEILSYEDVERLVDALKAQEPIKPILKRKALNAIYNDYVCPICNQEIVYEQKFCCECGRAVKWDD